MAAATTAITPPSTPQSIDRPDFLHTIVEREVPTDEPNASSPKSGSIPPPPAQFANTEDTLDEKILEQKDDARSRKSSKESVVSSRGSDKDGELQVQFRNSFDKTAPKSRPDIRRSISVEDSKSASPSPTTSVPPCKLNTSTITINTEINQLHQQADPSNSLASNVSQVLVVTSHPPIIVDNSAPNHRQQKLAKSLSVDTTVCSPSNEVVIVSNEMNKSHVHESSTDDDYQSYDNSLESSPKYSGKQKPIIKGSGKKARKLDESEVLIVSSDIFEEDLSEDNKLALDTSHVSVVTVGDDLDIKVKDSSHIVDSNSDLSTASAPPSEAGDDVMKVELITHSKTNGQSHYNKQHTSASREDVSIIVNKKRVSPDSSVDCSSSMDSPTRTHSENGSVRSSNNDSSTKRVGISINHKMVDRNSDAESISTTTSQDSREQPNPEPETTPEVTLRRKPEADQRQVSPKRQTRTKEEIQLSNLKKKTRKRTRKFEIDGVQVTTTTSKVIYGDDDSGRLYDDHIFRKQELRELKMLQKMEKKQFYDLQSKETIAKEQQEKKFDQERISLERTYEADMEVLARQHRQTSEKYEQQQENELRNTSKRIRGDQERELKLVSTIFLLISRTQLYYFHFNFQFRDALKQEIRLLKQEIDLLPKDRRKDEFRKRKTSMELEHEDREKQFLANLSEQHEIALRRISEIYREKLSATEKGYLQQRQTVCFDDLFKNFVSLI